eukprot:6471519-Amphidinium_carterae.1
MTSFNTQPPKLRGYAGHIRKAIPFFAWLVEQWPNQLEAVSQEQTLLMQAMQALAACYDCLSHSSKGDLKLQTTIFACLFKQLHGLSPAKYHPRPKLHMFLELGAMGVNPSDVWLYREEDFGGSLAKMGRVQGGHTTAASSSKLVLDKFRIKERLPAILM